MKTLVPRNSSKEDRIFQLICIFGPCLIIMVFVFILPFCLVVGSSRAEEILSPWCPLIVTAVAIVIAVVLRPKLFPAK